MERRRGRGTRVADGTRRIATAAMVVAAVVGLPPDAAQSQEVVPGDGDGQPPATDQPALDQPALDQPALDQPALDQPALDQPAAAQQAADLAAAQQLVLLEQLVARRAEAAASVAAAKADLLDRQKELEALAERIAVTEADLVAAETAASEGKSGMRSAAVNAFMSGGSTSTAGRDDWSDVIAGQERVGQFSGAALEGLRRRLDSAVAARDLLLSELEESNALRASLTGRVAEAEVAVADAEEHLRAITALEAVSTELSRSGFDVDPGGGLTLMGEAVVSAPDMAAFVRSSGSPHPSIDLEGLASLYLEEGAAEGVRGDVAFVQSILETGWFSFRNSMVDVTDNNFAGIGACDSCSDGYWYPTARDGVRAQMQLLRIYAEPGLRSEDLANPPVRSAPERVSVRGCCDTWAELTGVWATADGYGTRILEIYADMASAQV